MEGRPRAGAAAPVGGCSRPARRPSAASAFAAASSARRSSSRDSSSIWRRRPWSSRRTASAVSPANHSSRARGVVTEPLRRDRRHGHREERLPRDDGELRDQLLEISACKDGEAPEALGARPLEELEGRCGILGEHGSSPRAERSCNGALGSRFDLERAERKLGATFRESARSRGKSFLLGEDTLGGPQALSGEPRALGEIVSLARSRSGGHRRFGGDALERAGSFRVPLGPRSELGELGGEPVAKRGGGLAPERETLAATLKSVQRRDGRLPRARSVGELVLGDRPLGEQRVEPRLGAAPPERGRIATLFRLGSPGIGVLQVELGDARAERRDLHRELLGALGGGRLQRQRTQALPYLLLDVPRPLDLHRHAGELQLCAMPATLELAETGGLLDERAAILRLRGEHLLDLPLADDRVHRGAEPDVGEELDEVGPAHGRPVDEVLALAAAHEAAGDRHLAEVELPEASVLVVEDELDLAVIRGLAIPGPGEEDVVRLLGAKLGRRERARGPDDRVRDVRLAGAVRADDDRDARLEHDLERVRRRI